MDKIKVLWMNNGDESTNDFRLCAQNNDISLQTCQSMGELKKHLFNESLKEWNAILINVDYKTYDKKKNKYSRSVNCLNSDIWQIIQENCIPYFFATDYEKVIPQALLSFKSFTKDFFLLRDPECLISRIKEEVNGAPERKVKNKYAKVCEFCSNPRLIRLLIKLERNEKEMQSDTTVPNECRKMLEWIRDETFFQDMNLPKDVIEKVMKRVRSTSIDASYYGDLDLNQFSNAIDCTNSSIIPEYVKRSFHLCCNITQPASHNTPIDQLIGFNQAPYVNKSLIVNLLNILYWCAIQNNNRE